jgi:DNA-binding PucR family transcriptional regulator
VVTALFGSANWHLIAGIGRTATTALGVHRNSVRHRVGQVERVLGVDLADAETRMELWFALRWAPKVP